MAKAEGKVQLSAWATDGEAETIRAAAKAERQSVSSFITLAALQRATDIKKTAA